MTTSYSLAQIKASVDQWTPCRILTIDPAVAARLKKQQATLTTRAGVLEFEFKNEKRRGSEARIERISQEMDSTKKQIIQIDKVLEQARELSKQFATFGTAVRERTWGWYPEGNRQVFPVVLKKSKLLVFIENEAGAETVTKAVEDAMKTWSARSNLKFELTDQKPLADIRLLITAQTASSSSAIGSEALDLKKFPDFSMQIGCGGGVSLDDIKRTALHEFGHALGLVHEHFNPTVKFPWVTGVDLATLIAAKYSVTRAEAKANYLDPIEAGKCHATTFDESSIMTYEIPAQFLDPTADPKYATKKNSAISLLDEKLVAQLYGQPLHN